MAISHRSTQEEPSSAPSLNVPIISAFVLGVVLTLVAAWHFHDPSSDSTSDSSNTGSPGPERGLADSALPRIAAPEQRRPSVSRPVRSAAGLASMTGEVDSSRDLMLELDRRFRNEEVDRQWASVHEEVIVNAIVGNEHDGFDVPDPKAVDIGCRRSMCRVRMTYDYEDDAAEMQTKMMFGMPRAISTAHTFIRPSDSGDIEMVMYAGSVGPLR